MKVDNISYANFYNTRLIDNRREITANDKIFFEKISGNETERKDSAYAQPKEKFVLQIGTRVTFSVNRDLNIFITTVTDPDREKIIRQVPPDDTINRLRFLKAYQKQTTDVKGNILDKIIG